jgi:hypothetical protein
MNKSDRSRPEYQNLSITLSRISIGTYAPRPKFVGRVGAATMSQLLKALVAFNAKLEIDFDRD